MIYSLTFLLWLGVCCLKAAIVYDGDCQWSYSSSNASLTLNLKSLSGETITAADADGEQYSYSVSVCSDGILCDIDQYVMGGQTYTPDGTCYTIAMWDDTITPIYSVNTMGNAQWEFTYPNGESSGASCKRKLILTFICSTDSSPVATAYETSTQCTYEMDISTKLACGKGGGGGGGSSSSGTSGGTIFIIILICLFAVYCIFGYIWNKVRHPEHSWGDVKSNTPHYSFWCNLPKYFIAGCVVTKEKIMGVGGSSSGNQHESIPETPTETQG